MTAVAEDLDLSWVTFTGHDPGEPCFWDVPEDCHAEALFRAVFDRACGHALAVWPLCLAHRDELEHFDKTHPGGWWCQVCDRPFRLLRIEPIR